MIKFVKGSTKQGQALMWRAGNYEGYDLDDVYGDASSAKWSAYRYCRDLFIKENGENFRIVSHNTFQFSVAWDMEIEYTNPRTGEVTMEEAIHLETRDSRYIILVNM